MLRTSCCFCAVALVAPALGSANATGAGDFPREGSATRGVEEAVLGGFARGMLLGATDTVGRRFAAGPDRNRVKMKSLDRCEAGRRKRVDVERIGPEGGRAAGHEVCGTPDLNFDFATDSFEFVRRVEPLDEERPAGTLALWGAGARRSFGGRTGGNAYAVRPELPFVGVDYTAGRFMFGTAVSWFDATGRYRLAHAGSGAVRLDLNGVYPYARYALGCRGPSRKTCRTELWAVGAMGQGDLVRGGAPAAGEPPSSDARMQLGLAGFRQRVAKAGSLDFVLRGDIGTAVIEGGDRFGRSGGSASLGGDAGRGRIGLEGSLTRKVGALVFRPFTQVAQRYDGGSSMSGTGTELVGGLEVVSADGRLRVHATGRTLVTQGRARYEEEGVGATIELRPATKDGEGLSLLVAQQFGGASTRANALWRSDAPRWIGMSPDALAAVSARRDPGASHTRAEVAWGVGIGASMVTPFAQAAAASATGREHLRLGVRHSMRKSSPHRVNLEVTAERPQVALSSDLDEYQLGVAGQVRVRFTTARRR
ncbi:MAG: hypothetical protein OXP74_06660 [Acidobacteriota bacterium]|nr:hypothetical protein [Acidobacteriota bacterium]